MFFTLLLFLLHLTTSHATTFGADIDPLEDDANFGQMRLLPVGQPISFQRTNEAGDKSIDPQNPYVVPHTLGGGFGGFLDALLGPNAHLREAPHIRFGRAGGDPWRDPFARAGGRPGSGLPGFPFAGGKDTFVYPYPEDCEDELKDQCLGLVRVCSHNGCTLECQKIGPAPKVSKKCLLLHPCAEDMEKFCKLMGDETKLFHCLIDNKKKVSKKCIASEACLQKDNKDCNAKGVGQHVFGRAATTTSTETPTLGNKAFGETHGDNDACSCKKAFGVEYGDFTGCGAHMTHPFCLPCGENCIRNPICGTGSLWCEVKDNDKCLTDKYVKTFEYSLDKVAGDKKYKAKFPKALLKIKYRKCKPTQLVGLGSWLKDLLGPVANKLEKDVQKMVTKGKDTKNTGAAGAAGAAAGGETPAQIEEAKMTVVGDAVDPDVVTPTELMKASDIMKTAKAQAAKAAQAKATAKTTNELKTLGNKNKQGVVVPPAIDAQLNKAAANDGGGRSTFMKYLWVGIGLALVGTVVVFQSKKKGRGRRRRSSNEKISREVGDEFL